MDGGQRRAELELEIRAAQAGVSALLHEIAVRRDKGESTDALQREADRLLELNAKRLGEWIALASQQRL